MYSEKITSLGDGGIGSLTGRHAGRKFAGMYRSKKSVTKTTKLPLRADIVRALGAQDLQQIEGGLRNYEDSCDMGTCKSQVAGG